MVIVAISDTHEEHRRLAVPDGDVLIHAGDITHRGDLDALRDFDDWLGGLPHAHKIVIAGNHDWSFQTSPREARATITNAKYLEDSGTVVGGLSVWGSPWQPWFQDWAFNVRRGAAIRAKWDLIPANTDILVTHGPPFGHGDLMAHGERVGCEELMMRLTEVKPLLHVCGHIHEGYGASPLGSSLLVNASSLDEHYDVLRPPIVVERAASGAMRLLSPAPNAGVTSRGNAGGR